MEMDDFTDESQTLQPGEVEATEQEQAELELAFNIALEFIHGQQGDVVAGMVLESQDVTEGIGKAVATVMISVEKKLGGLSDDVKMQLSQEVLAELSGLAVEAGALSEDEITDDWIDQAVSHAYSNYLSMKEALGELDQSELEGSVSEAEQFTGKSMRNQQLKQPQPQGLLAGGGL